MTHSISNLSPISRLPADLVQQRILSHFDFHDLSLIACTSKSAELSILARDELKGSGPEWEQKKAQWIQGDSDYCGFFNEIIGRVKMNRLPALKGRRKFDSISLEDFPIDQPIIKFKKGDGSPCLAFYLSHKQSAFSPRQSDIHSIEIIFRVHPSSELWSGQGFKFFQLVHYIQNPNAELYNERETAFLQSYLSRLLKNQPCGLTLRSEGEYIELDPKTTEIGESVVSLCKPPGKERELDLRTPQ